MSIEIGIFYNVQRKENICKLCKDNQIGDECHFIKQCNALYEKRKKFLKGYYYDNPSTLIFASLLNSSENILYDLCKFIELIKGKL